jgi:hypothetical protein
MKVNIYVLIYLIIFSCKNDKKETIKDITTLIEKKEGISKLNFYNNKNELLKTLEYIDLCGKKYLNQGWYFNKNHDTIYKKSNFFKIKIEKNVLKENEKTKINIFYKPYLDNCISVLLLSRENIENNYCEILKSKSYDTIYFINNKIEYYQSLEGKGKSYIGGYILEVKKLDKKINNKSVYDERKVYVKIPFFVK